LQIKFFIFLFLFSFSFVSGFNVTINNYGLRDFEESNQSYTPYYSVVLLIDDYLADSNCRFCNDNSSVKNFCNLELSWSNWQKCDDVIFWELEDFTGNGSAEEKFVFAQYDSDDDLNFDEEVYATIFYDYTGRGLDVTPPNKGVNIYDGGNYTAFNDSISVWWDGGFDKESNFLNIPLEYEVRVLENFTPITGWFDVGEQTEVKINLPFEMIKGNNYSVEVKTINSVGLYLINVSDGIFYDSLKPNLTIDYVDGTSWTNNSKVEIYFSGQDLPSGVKGFSYRLNDEENFLLNDLIDSTGSNGNVSFFLPSGIFYFHIKAIDNAGNIGDTSTIPIYIDITPPTKPVFNSSILYSYDDNITWSPSVDLDSGVVDYYVQVSYDNNFEYFLQGGWINSSQSYFSLSNFNLSPGYYYVRVKAIDGVGLESVFSNEQDFLFDKNPPLISRTHDNSFVLFESPSFSIDTNEDAKCYYRKEDEFVIFDYTGYMRHDVFLGNFFKVPATDNIVIRCIDSAGNIADSSFEITAKEFNSLSTIRIFPSENYVNTHLSENNRITQYVGSRLELKIDVNPKFDNLYSYFNFELNPILVDNLVFENYLKSENYKISSDVDYKSPVFKNIFNFDYGLNYLGNGIYDLVLEVPKIPGIYELIIKVGDISRKIEIEIIDLELLVSYVNLEGNLADLNNIEKNLLYYSFDNYSLGLVSNQKSEFFLYNSKKEEIVEKDLTNHDVAISSPISSEYFIFLTRKSNSLNLKNRHILDNNYKKLDVFNFGFSTDFENLVEVFVADEELLFSLDKEFGLGKYTILLENKGHKDSLINEIVLKELDDFSISKDEAKYVRFDTYG